MALQTPYATILAEVARLRRTGALERRGRPPTDPEALSFATEIRAFSQALQGTRSSNPDALRQSGMPTSFQRQWDREVKLLNSDVIDTPSDHSRQSAYTRRRNSSADGQLLTQAKANADAKKLRIEVIKRAMEAVRAKGYKSKTVAREMLRLNLLEIRPDTLRKLLTEIRRGRAT